MEVLCANTLSYDPRQQLSKIFTDGFYQWLKFFSKDKEKLSRTFSHMFNLDVFYVVLLDDKVVGMAAINNGQQPTLHLSKHEFQKNLG